MAASNLPKSEPFFVRISALASKMGQIEKRIAHHIMLIIDLISSNIISAFILMICSILEATAEVLTKNDSLFGSFEETKISF